ncbi:hypothetical protein [Parasphingorhabdus sp.]|uniref:hypothetical protein n=1 Tax=Parasphingorhabdus sp. TaxID=2709688 RepID=UPI003BB0B5F1
MVRSTSTYKQFLLTTSGLLIVGLPSAVHAQVAANTANVSAPAGAFETDASNNSASDSDTVFAAIVATNDSATGINGASGATAVVNAFTADTINGVAASAGNATLSVATGSTVPAGLTFDVASGNVDVAAGTPAGTYTFDYEICETLNPTNCQIATISVTVDAAPITAGADTPPAVNGATGGDDIVNAFDNDTLNGAAVDPADITATITTPATPASPGAPVPVMDPATGLVDVPAGTPAGSYTITSRYARR